MADADVLRWGIISTAKIAAEHVVPALQSLPNCEVVAVGSRDLDRATEFGAAHNIARCYGTYEELFADAEIDAVYNPLPNHLHAPVTKQAAAAGKHVLSEKPFTMDSGEAVKLVADLEALDTGAVVMEAFMYQFHPQWEAVLEMVRGGKIGRVVAVQTWFSYFGDDPANIRHVPEWGGGALMDIGCYAIHSVRQIFDAEPTRVRGTLEIHEEFGVDVTTSAVLDFPTGQATFTVATQSNPDQRVHIIGDSGRIELTRPFNAQKTMPMVVRYGPGLGQDYGEPLETMAFGPADQYAIMADRFTTAVLAGQPAPVGLADAVANMKVIDAVRKSA